MADVKIGEMVVYQCNAREWPMGATPAPALVCDYDEEAETASLLIFHAGAAYITETRNPVKYGEGDGEFMKVGEESKTAKALKKAKEEAKKAAEEQAKAEEEKALKAEEEAKEKPAFPTTQQQLERDQARAIAQYNHPHPQEA